MSREAKQESWFYRNDFQNFQSYLTPYNCHNLLCFFPQFATQVYLILVKEQKINTLEL